MLKIRLQRVGKINAPSYRVIVTEHARGPKTGNFLEVVGTYDPRTKARTLEAERIKYWISKGAQPSGTMHNMLISAGVITGKKVNVLPKKTVAKPVEPEASSQKPEEVAETKPEASSSEPVEEVAPTPEETPATDVPAEEAAA
jgi:small subunit ribosomal protein S16